MKFYYTDTYERDIEPIKLDIATAFNIAISSQDQELNILVDQVASLDGTFSEIFGLKLASKLAKEKVFKMSGVKCRLITGSMNTTIKGTLLGLEVRIEKLNKFVESKSLEGVVYCPLHKKEGEEYARIYSGAIKL